MHLPVKGMGGDRVNVRMAAVPMDLEVVGGQDSSDQVQVSYEPRSEVELSLSRMCDGWLWPAGRASQS